MKNRETPTKKEYPENIRQFMDLVSAILKRIKDKHLNDPDILDNEHAIATIPIPRRVCPYPLQLRFVRARRAREVVAEE